MLLVAAVFRLRGASRRYQPLAVAVLEEDDAARPVAVLRVVVEQEVLKFEGSGCFEGSQKFGQKSIISSVNVDLAKFEEYQTKYLSVLFIYFLEN